MIMPSAVITQDVSLENDGSIIASFVESTITPNYYEVIVCSKMQILANVDSSGMLSGLGTVYPVEIIFDNFDTSFVENMSDMFAGTGITSLDLSNFITENLLYMDRMFYGCDKLLYLNLSSFDVTNVISKSGAFSYCDSSIKPPWA